MSQVTTTTLFICALGLSMDTLAVSGAIGLAFRPITLRLRFRVVWHFTLFQVGLLALGWWGGSLVESVISHYDHWIGAGLLWLIALRMGRDWWQNKVARFRSDPSRGMTLIALSTATSIDALILGASFGVLQAPIDQAVPILALATASMAILGIELGRLSGRFVGRWGSLLGAIVLMALGIKVLIEHNA